MRSMMSGFSWRARTAVLTLMVLVAAAAILVRSRGLAGASADPKANAQAALSDYKTLPVYFERNRGQTDARVKFLSRGPGYTLFLTGQGAVMALRKVDRAPASATKKGAEHAAKGGLPPRRCR
jgi:hypothetical protein